MRFTLHFPQLGALWKAAGFLTGGTSSSKGQTPSRTENARLNLLELQDRALLRSAQRRTSRNLQVLPFDFGIHHCIITMLNIISPFTIMMYEKWQLITLWALLFPGFSYTHLVTWKTFLVKHAPNFNLLLSLKGVYMNS